MQVLKFIKQLSRSINLSKYTLTLQNKRTKRIGPWLLTKGMARYVYLFLFYGVKVYFDKYYRSFCKQEHPGKALIS